MKKRLALVFAVSLAAVGLSYGVRGVQPATEPKEILNRIWFDRLPDTATDEYTIALFFGGGVGVYETGTRYRGAYDTFEFERRNSELDVKFLQDKRKLTARFTITSCDEKPPFNLCLDFEGTPPKGPKRLYGFSYADEESKAIPWAKDLRAAGRAKSGAR